MMNLKSLSAVFCCGKEKCTKFEQNYLKLTLIVKLQKEIL